MMINIDRFNMKHYNFIQTIKEKLNSEDFCAINDKIKDHLSRHYISIDNLIYIGGGNNGIAYASDDKVVKITKDNEEIETAKKLQGMKNKNLVNIYEVVKLNNELCFIIQERVDTTNNELKKCRCFILDRLQEGYFDFEELICGEEMSDVLDLNSCTFLGEKCNDFNLNFIYSAFLAYKELKNKTGIRSTDFHVFNSGLRNDGSVVFFDQKGALI